MAIYFRPKPPGSFGLSDKVERQAEWESLTGFYQNYGKRVKGQEGKVIKEIIMENLQN